MGLKEINFGDKVRPLTIEKVKFTTQFDTILGILSRDIQVAYLHFLDGVGSFYCFNGACCKLGGLPKVTYILPVVVYSGVEVDNYGPPFSIKWWGMSQATYDGLLKKDKLKQDITAFDLLITCKEDKYQQITIDVIDGTACKWRSDPRYVAAITKEHQRYRSLIATAVGRELDETTLYQSIARAQEKANALGSGNSSFRSGVPIPQQAPLPEPPKQLVASPPVRSKGASTTKVIEAEAGDADLFGTPETARVAPAQKVVDSATDVAPANLGPAIPAEVDTDTEEMVPDMASGDFDFSDLIGGDDD